ncbi:MAG: hypothetical protein JXJ20_10815 [Anaerolineae bacterium]|jgi:hypothetical protein|nr:hypothetical protein [Anaerolineae bacterium]
MPDHNEARYVSPVERWSARIDRMGRRRRIILALLITLELVALTSLIIDRLLIGRVVEGDVNPMTPALIEAGLGLLFYGIGWWAMVGFDWDPQSPWRAGRPAVVYTVLGAASLVLLVLLVLFGLVFGYVL